MQLLLTLLLFFSPPVHDYHVSKTNVRYVAERGQVQVEMQVFVDDLEDAMVDAGAPRLDIGTKDEHPETNRYLTAYLDKHFRVEWNGESLPVQLVGYELEDDMHGLWIYLAADDVADPEGITVENTVITEYYADQKNIVKLFNGQQRLATLLMDRNRPAGKY
ncbi:hypothetical protein GGR26_001980 [Lewinella marina]|uniref:Uncharacterized protein n=1 Tax=Neolewinella marina TaxID=438751 RepID=A0A2G0CH59_9BACT|nr:DUF6702 family protein [Neolewinella marina]NJB86212.1 hypothetical protein [Neolewinella marina]PHK99314.1 hypothetical protein CGL56_07625 [Neolewinella marina]